jgi:hypothetical protein
MLPFHSQLAKTPPKDQHTAPRNTKKQLLTALLEATADVKTAGNYLRCVLAEALVCLRLSFVPMPA